MRGEERLLLPLSLEELPTPTVLQGRLLRLPLLPLLPLPPLLLQSMRRVLRSCEGLQ